MWPLWVLELIVQRRLCQLIKSLPVTQHKVSSPISSGKRNTINIIQHLTLLTTTGGSGKKKVQTHCLQTWKASLGVVTCQMMPGQHSKHQPDTTLVTSRGLWWPLWWWHIHWVYGDPWYMLTDIKQTVCLRLPTAPGVCVCVCVPHCSCVDETCVSIVLNNT